MNAPITIAEIMANARRPQVGDPEIHPPTFRRFFSRGFLRLYRDGVQIASAAGSDATERLDAIQEGDQ